jgi:MYXO-CTERM domain-containing protein
VESFATLQPALLNNLLAAQADEAYCEAGDDDDSSDDDDDDAADDDDSSDDDDDIQPDDDDDSAEAFHRCGTRDEYGLICGEAADPSSVALGLLLLSGFGLVRRREVL